MSNNSQTCPSCGAHVPADAERCDLCGTSVEASSGGANKPDDEGPVESDASPTTEETDADSADTGDEDAPSVFCNLCGWENPPGAQYCSRCGEELQDLSEATPAGTRRVSAELPPGTSPDAPTDAESADAPDERETDDQAAMGRQIVLVVGGALVLVLGLFFVTQWSNQYEWDGESGTSAPSTQAGTDGTGSPSASGGERPMRTPGQEGQQPAPTDLQALLNQTADSLTGPIAGQIDSLKTRMEKTSGGNKRQIQAELVNLFIGAGHPGRAALVQRDLAEATGSVDAQRRSADLLYRWMQKLQGQEQRKQVFQVARHAAQAYEKVAEQRPDDLDARTRMGEAYLLTNEPMQGIEAINAVLDDDSTFVPARFQKGLALLQINRLDQAMKQFERVKQYAEAESPFYRQADQAVKVIKKQQTQSSSGESTPASGADR